MPAPDASATPGVADDATTDHPTSGRGSTGEPARPAAVASDLTGDDVVHLARLARIDLGADERELLAGQLSQIISAVARVSEVARPEVPATSHPMPLGNVWRPDEPRPSLPRVDVLAGAPVSEDDRFRVPRILEED